MSDVLRTAAVASPATWRQRWAGCPRYERVLWILLLLTALVPRLLYVQPFLENSYRQNLDEAYSIKVALSFSDGDLNPHRWGYPTFYPYLLAATYGLIFAVGRLTGVYSSTGEFAGQYFADPRVFMWPGRYLSLVAGIWQILVAKAIAQRVFGPTAGWITAFGLALSSQHISMTSTKPDAFALLFATLAIGALCSLVRGPTLKGYLWAGVFIGLGTGTKYWPAFLLPVALGTHLYIVLRPMRGDTGQRVPWHWVLWAAVACGVAFFVCSPFHVLAYKEALAGVTQSVTGGGSTGQWGKPWAEPPRPWPNLLKFSLADAGAPWVVAAVAGLALALWRRSAERLIIVCSALVIVAVFLRHRISAGSYLAPSFPLLWMLAGFAMQEMARRSWGVRLRQVALGVAVAAVLTTPFVGTLRRSVAISHTDTWTLGERVFAAIVPEGATVWVDDGLNLKNAQEDALRAAQQAEVVIPAADPRGASGRREKIWGQFIKYAKSPWYREPPHTYRVAAGNVLGLESWPIYQVSVDDFSPIEIDQLREAGIEYVVTSGLMLDRYGPTDLPKREFYDSLKADAELIGEVTPEEGVVMGPTSVRGNRPVGWGSRTGPSIFIYRLDGVASEFSIDLLQRDRLETRQRSEGGGPGS